MKSRYFFILILIFSIASFNACNKENSAPDTPVIEVKGVYVWPETLSLEVGSSSELSVIVSPKNATDRSVVWTSSKPSVATVSNKGLVTAVGNGEAIITATSTNGIHGQCTVTVEKQTPVTEVQVLPSTLTLNVEASETLSTIIKPDDATDKSIAWASSRPEVATVDDNGKVTAVGNGEAIITATSVNGVQGKCTVTVVTPVTGVQVEPSTLTLKIGDTQTLSTSIKPENATDKTIVWASSRPDVATVDNNGKVTAVGSGEAIITATSTNGIQGKCTVTVGKLSSNAHTEDMQEIPGPQGSYVIETSQPKMKIYFPESWNNTCGLVVSCAGGSYSSIPGADSFEGSYYRNIFHEAGFAFAVLFYTMPNGDRSKPFSDIENALKLVRAKAGEWKVNPNRVGVLGFSAGGHLASTAATHGTGDAHPDFQVLFYPVITMQDGKTHATSRKNLLGESPSEDLINEYSNELKVTASTPPAFLTYATGDRSVVPTYNVVAYKDALTAAHVPVACYSYDDSTHGWHWGSYIYQGAPVSDRTRFPYMDDVVAKLSAWLQALYQD